MKGFLLSVVIIKDGDIVIVVKTTFLIASRYFLS